MAQTADNAAKDSCGGRDRTEFFITMAATPFSLSSIIS